MPPDDISDILTHRINSSHYYDHKEYKFARKQVKKFTF